MGLTLGSHVIIALFFLLVGIIIISFLSSRKRNRREKETKRFEEIFGIRPTLPNQRTPGEGYVIKRALAWKMEVYSNTSRSKDAILNRIKVARENSSDDFFIVQDLKEDEKITYITINENISTIAELVASLEAQSKELWGCYLEAQSLAERFGYKYEADLKEFCPPTNNSGKKLVTEKEVTEK